MRCRPRASVKSLPAPKEGRVSSDCRTQAQSSLVEREGVPPAYTMEEQSLKVVSLLMAARVIAYS